MLAVRVAGRLGGHSCDARSTEADVPLSRGITPNSSRNQAPRGNEITTIPETGLFQHPRGVNGEQINLEGSC
jgi:hypothetical protein